MRLALLSALGLCAPLALWGQEPSIALDQAECLPVGDNGALTARVVNEPPGASLRFYFRRLHGEVEDFYYVVGRATGGGRYEATLPRAADRAPEDHSGPAGRAAWWRAREESQERGPRAEIGSRASRTWLRQLGDEELGAWLDRLVNEPVEYHAVLFDATGEEVAWSDGMLVVEVRAGCEVELSDRQRGEAENLTVGETANWQTKEEPFHWQCEGLVTRIGPDGVPAADHRCRDTFGSLFAELAEEEQEAARAIVTGPSGKQPFRKVKVFYGTDRQREAFNGAAWEWDDPGDRAVSAYAGRRGDDESLELGTCEVSIPLDHARGETEAPGFFEKEDPKKHVVLLSVTPHSRAVFVADLASEIAFAPDKAALVFIHGYNVSFEDAARRTAQIAYDLAFGGVPLMYSWPSQAELTGYTIDEANIRWTVPHLERFLELVTRETGAEKVHVIAHSMGNRAFTEVLRRFAAEKGPAAPRFNQIALVAPDVDADVFHQEIASAIRCAGAPCVSDRVTLYASRQDKALLASKKLHGHPRAGDVSDGLVLTAGIEIVDASEVDTSLLRAISLGHSYFADKPTVIEDLAQAIAGTSPDAAERAGRLSPRGSGNRQYWVLKP